MQASYPRIGKEPMMKYRDYVFITLIVVLWHLLPVLADRLS
jgi:hypothetical protein